MRLLYDADASTGGGTADGAADSTNGAGTANPAQRDTGNGAGRNATVTGTDNPTKSSDTQSSRSGNGAGNGSDASDAAVQPDAKAYERIIRSEYRTKVFSHFETNGLSVLKDKSNRPDLEATIKATANEITKLREENRQLKSNQLTPEQRNEHEVLRAQINQFDTERSRLESQVADAVREKDEFIHKTKITTALSSLKLHDKALKPAVEQFAKEVEMLRDDTGTEYVKWNGEVVFNDQQKPASLEEAARKFIDANPFYAAATTRSGNGTTTTVAGAARAVTKEMLAAGDVDPMDLVKGRAVLVD